MRWRVRRVAPLDSMGHPAMPQHRQQIVELVQSLKQPLHFASSVDRARM
jgi:hypothetical protein